MERKNRTADVAESVNRIRSESPEITSEKKLKKLTRKVISGVYGRRVSSAEVKGVLKKMEDTGVIVRKSKSLVVGAWMDDSDTLIVMKESKPKAPKIKDKVVETTEVKKDIEFVVMISATGFVRGSIWKEQAKVLADFGNSTVLEFKVDKTSKKEVTKFFETVKEIRDKGMKYHFDSKTDPRIIEIFDKVFGLEKA